MGERSTVQSFREAALRHARYYEVVLREVDEQYRIGKAQLGVELFDLDWPNIECGQRWAATCTADDEAALLCLSYCQWDELLGRRLHPQVRIQWMEAGLAAARQLGDRWREAWTLGKLGLANHDLGQYQRAIGFYEQDLVIARGLGDREGEGSALGNLGNTYLVLGEHRQAIDYHEQDLEIARELADRREEGGALGNLGNAYNSLGNYRRAID